MIEHYIKNDLDTEEHICKVCCQRQIASAAPSNRVDKGNKVHHVAETAAMSDSEDDFHDATVHHVEEKGYSKSAPLCYTCSENK